MLSMKEIVAAWKKSFIEGKIGPYLIDTEETDKGKRYHIVWGETHKRKRHYVVRAGYLEDGMYCRYGVSTYCTISGPTPFDIDYGKCDPKIFDIMKRVYLGETEDLVELDIDQVNILD